MKVLEKNAPDALQGHHAKTMSILFIYMIFTVLWVFVPLKLFGMELNWVMGLPFFLAPLVFILVFANRSSSAVCPECGKSMRVSGSVRVVEDQPLFKRYGVSEWEVVTCDACSKQWRIPGISSSEGDSISSKEYLKLLEDEDS